MDAENFQRWVSLLQGLPIAGKLGISTAVVAIAAAFLILVWQSPRTSPPADSGNQPPSQGSSSVASIGQSGGQTAGVINNYISPAPLGQPPSQHDVAPNKEPQPGSHGPPIAWDFAQGNLADTGMFAIAEGSGGYWVVGYQFVGRNVSDSQLTNINAYVRPDNTGEKIPLKFATGGSGNPPYVDPQQTLGIPPQAAFWLKALLKIPDDGRKLPALSTQEYLESYGGFSFVFECSECETQTYTSTMRA